MERRPFLARLAMVLLLALLGVLIPGPMSGSASTLLPGFTETQLTNALNRPTAMAFAPDGRLFITQQDGAVLIFKNGALLSTPFMVLTVDSFFERGLLGIALDPNFATNSYLYLYYTTSTAPVHNRLSRFTANGDVVLPGSELVLLDLDNLSAGNHNGGALQFGPDGKLYVAVGENAVPSNAQSLANLHGKMLRLNRDGSVPSDNPFAGSPTVTPRNQAIWALGFRNPYTFDIQPGTGRLFINDVGQDTWEEINDGQAGANYGWPQREGRCVAGSATNCPAPPAGLTDPLYAYRNESSTCAITGGAFYNPTVVQFPASYVGTYFFADYCAAWIKSLNLTTGNVTTLASGTPSGVTSIRIGPDGSLYYLSYNGASLNRIQNTGIGAPQIGTQPISQTITAGRSVTFSVGATGSPPLRYQWQRNGVDIPGATSPSYTIGSVTLADSGAQFHCIVSNDSGSTPSSAAILTVVTNQAPSASITQPTSGTTYAAGTTLTYAGSASDPEDGALPASAFTWRIDFHHDDHNHPFLPPTTNITGGSIVIPDRGETSTNVFYRVTLTVRDSGGLTTTVSRDIQPRTATITLASSPPGLALTLDGSPVVGPISVASVVGVIRTLGVVPSQTIGGVTYTFTGWSNGGAATQEISTAPDNLTYTALYTVSAATPAPATSWYFAEGYTGPGFDEYLTILNPNGSAADVTITYYLASGTPIDRTLVIGPFARATVAVHETTTGVGRDQEVGARVRTTNGLGIVVERPIYFRYTGRDGRPVTDGHTVLGATALSTRWYFAEGYTGSGFDQYLTLLNPGATPAVVQITYYLPWGGTQVRTFTLPAGRRDTVRVHELDRGVGPNQEVSTLVETTNGVGIIAERPTYFTYQLTPAAGGGTVDGGHNALGVTAPRASWYFAEGYTGAGFDEYLTILNPSANPAVVSVTYYLTNSPPRTVNLTLTGTSRRTIRVHELGEGVGRNQAVAARVTTTSPDGIVVERPIYFRYQLSAGAGGGSISGGHNDRGAAAPRVLWYLAEGYTGPGFDEFLTLLNPQPVPAGVAVTYFATSGVSRTISLSLPPSSRQTIAVHATDQGVGREQAVAVRIVTTNPDGIVVERPIYFRYGGGIDGGHLSGGYAP